MVHKLMVAAALSAAALGTALPTVATAQAYRPAPGYGWDANTFWRDAPQDTYQRITWLQRRIDRGTADGSLTRVEARRSQMELNSIRRGAWRMRARYGGTLSARDQNLIQARLDNLSQRIRWQRHNDRVAGDPDRYATSYDATRYYRDDPRYTERSLTANDQVYRGSDGRYYCKRNDGTTGLIVGGAGGALLGNIIDGGHNRVAGTLIGGALGALAGKSIDQNQVRCR